MALIESGLRYCCPECGTEVTIWKRVCFGHDPHNEYHCFHCGWNGRNPTFAVPVELWTAEKTAALESREQREER